MQIFGEIVPAAAEAAAQDDGDRGGPQDDDDEDDDSRQRPAPRRGTKRKLETEKDEMEGGFGRLSGYSAQRQSVFNVFMCKLHRYRQVPDPSLLRSVLICNTLRSIEREMVRDGFEPETGYPESAVDASPAVVVETNFVPPAFQQQGDADESMETSEPIHPSSSSTAIAVIIDSCPNPNPTYTAMMPLEPVCSKLENDPVAVTCFEKSLGDLDCSGRATPYPSPDLDPCRNVDDDTRINDDDNEEHKDKDDERQSINWGSVLNFSSQVDVDGGVHPVAEDAWTYEEADEEEEEELDEVDGDENDEDEINRNNSNGGPNTSPSASSDSGISTASDEIFGDIDLSLYDFDLVPLSPPSGARQAALPPSAEELLCSFPGERTIVLPPSCGNGVSALQRHRTSAIQLIRTGHVGSDTVQTVHLRGTHTNGDST